MQNTEAMSEASIARAWRKNWNETMYGFPRHWNETIVKYADGSIYKGHLTRHGQRTGIGVYIYYVPVTEEVNDRIECLGIWEDDKPQDKISIVRINADGKRAVVFYGKWQDAKI